MRLGLARLVGGRRRLVVVRPLRRDLETLASYATGAAPRLHAVVERTFPLSEFADAFRVVESKRARGKVVVTLSPGAV